MTPTALLQLELEKPAETTSKLRNLDDDIRTSKPSVKQRIH